MVECALKTKNGRCSLRKGGAGFPMPCNEQKCIFARIEKKLDILLEMEIHGRSDED